MKKKHCYRCKQKLDKNTAWPCALRGTCHPQCKKCGNLVRTLNERKHGTPAKNYQRFGKKHVFPCGCSGFLSRNGKPNKFAIIRKGKAYCRVITSLQNSVWTSRQRGHRPITKMPHTVLRKMMDQPCVYCERPLNWLKLGQGKTPHLDHDHKTGKVNGYAHAVCNSQDLKGVVKRLQNKIQKLESRS